MSKRDAENALARWRDPKAKRQEEPIGLVLEVLELQGFEVRQGRNGHYVAKHNALSNPTFAMRAITISAHAHGKQGIVPKTTINLIVEAIEEIEEI